MNNPYPLLGCLLRGFHLRNPLPPSACIQRHPLEAPPSQRLLYGPGHPAGRGHLQRLRRHGVLPCFTHRIRLGLLPPTFRTPTSQHLVSVWAQSTVQELLICSAPAQRGQLHSESRRQQHGPSERFHIDLVPQHLALSVVDPPYSRGSTRPDVRPSSSRILLITTNEDSINKDCRP